MSHVLLVLHAHLPFVRHPEHRYHLEENWLYEATVATYLPLIEMMRGLERDHVRYRLTMSMSPPLVTMLRDDLLKTRTAAYLDRLVALGERERVRTYGQAGFAPLSVWYHERFLRLRALYDSINGDLVGELAQLQRRGSLEIITVGATHGYQPVLREHSARRAQIELACRSYERAFGLWPRGIWLPECGYVDGVDVLCADAGLRYFFADGHAVTFARPRPPYGVHAPIYTPAGVAVLGRDAESGKQVWSSKEGYPGDGAYRDFYRDIGFDLPIETIGDFVHPDGIRVHTGYKYFRVTGDGVDLADKQPYDPGVAEGRADEHAGHFVFCRGAQMEHLRATMDVAPVVVSPYDAELFGHWWFEGPVFLDRLARRASLQKKFRLSTAPEVLDENPIAAMSSPCPSSWGEGGYSAVWVDNSNDWIYPHVHHCEARMHELARRFAHPSDLERRALNQAARELVLAQASDWAFIMKTKTAVEYACDRVKAHLARFRRLDRALVGEQLGNEAGWLTDLESRDNIFPEIDYRLWS
jgi:1,4-alpha-glucan branching enzyme